MQPYPPLGTLYAAALPARARATTSALFDAMLAESEAEWDAALDARAAAVRGALRGQLQLPLEDVPAADARGRVPRCSAWRARAAARVIVVRLRRHRPRRRATSTHGADYVHRRRGRGDARRAPRRADAGGPRRARARSPAWRFRDAARRRRSHRRARPDIKDLDALPVPGLGPGRRRALPAASGAAPRLLLDEHGHDPRLPVPLQLVRQADLGPALQRPQSRRTSSPSWRWLKATYRPDHIWFADDIFGLKPGWLARVRRPCSKRRTRACPFKCLSRADLLLREGEVEALRAGRRRDGLDRRRVRLAADPRRDGEGHDGRADRRGAPAAARGRHRGRLLPAVRLSGRDARRTSRRRCSWCATAARTTSASRCRYPLPGTRFYERVRERARRAAELGRLGRPGDALPRPLLDRVLPPAARRRCTPSSVRAELPRAARRRPGTRLGSGRATCVVPPPGRGTAPASRCCAAASIARARRRGAGRSAPVLGTSRGDPAPQAD